MAAAVRMVERPSSMTKQLARIFLAPSWLFSPMRMAISGAPPMPIKKAKEEMRVTIGPHTPAPARAISPTSLMFPIYMRSTML